MDLRIEIVGDRIVCWQDGEEVGSSGLKAFLDLLVGRSDSSALPDAIPEGVRFIRHRSNAVAVVMQEDPQTRTVRWLADNSAVPYGKDAVYRTTRLAFPFVVVVLIFRAGRLTGYQQCFFRTEPLEKLDDKLLLPNLFNVAHGHGQQCWLCLANLKRDLAPSSWNEKIRIIRKHLWGAGFNRSSEVHEGNSYWQTMREVDTRVASLDAWEQATQTDPFFPLRVNWKPAGTTVGEVVEGMLAMVAPPQVITSADHLVPLITLSRQRPALRKVSTA
jgi:hypothetical protein